jgi:hypothetical protein
VRRLLGALGVALILNPGLAVQELFGAGLSGDNAMARGTGIVLLVLCIRCWPNGHDVDRRPLLGLLTKRLGNDYKSNKSALI